MAQVPQQEWDVLKSQVDRVFHEVADLRTSRSRLRHLGEGPKDTWSGFGLNMDANQHVELVKLLAGYGHPETLALLQEIAGAKGDARYPDRQDDADLAAAILAEVSNPSQSVGVNSQPALAPQVVYVDRPAPTAELVPIATNGDAKTTAEIIGGVYAAIDQLNLADALDIKDRATLAATIKILETKNGATL